jgi:DNA modification methylase
MIPRPISPETIPDDEPAKPPCANPVQMWPIDRPKPNPDNARTHADEQVGQVGNSIETFQSLRTVLVDEYDYILAGHAIWLAHRRLARQQIAVQVIDHLTELQKRAFLVADNQIALNSEWDEEKLRALVAKLEKELRDVGVLGFKPEELDRLLQDLAPEQIFVDEDEVPMTSVRSVSLPGDVWILDQHRLLCGDSTQAEDLAAALEGSPAHMVFADAPYNVGYRQKRARRPEGIAIANDDLGEEFEQFLYSVCVQLLAVCRGAVYLCMSSSELHTLFKAFTEAGGHWSTTIVWAKDRFTLGRSNYQRQYEPILYGWREGQEHYWNGSRKQGDVWFVPKPKANRLHPTMKPVSLIERAIRNSSRRGDVVLDPFGGSGSTLIACEKTGRRAALVELEPRYVDVTIRRWEAYTHQVAHLEKDGRTFAAVAQDRLQKAA